MNVLCLCMVAVLSAGTTLEVSEDFGAYPEGSDGAPRWKPFGAIWEVRDGVYHADTDAFDAGSSLGEFIEDGFRAEVELNGYRAGLYFSLDSRDNRACSHMIRFEGKDILWGYFDGAGVYRATGTAHTSSDPGSWRRVAIEVSPRERSYQVRVDGELVGDNRSLEFPSGYFGLQASYGRSSFRNVSLKVTPEPLPEAAEKTRHLGHLGLAGVDRKGRIVVADRARSVVLMLNAEGQEIGRYGAPACTLRAPSAAAAGPLDRVYVCDTGNSRVVVFEEDGGVAGMVQFPEMKEPVGLALDQLGNSWVVDRQARAVHRIDRWGQLRASWGSEILEEPFGVDLEKNTLWISDAAGAVHLFDATTGELQASHPARFSSPRGLLLRSGQALVADAGKGTVELLGRNGEYRASYDRSPFGPFTCPRGVIEVEDRPVVIDYDRLVFLPMAEEFEPQIGAPVPGKIRVSWTSLTEAIGEVRYGPRGGWERMAQGHGPGFRHAVTLTDLEPSRRYRYRLRPTTKVIPHTDEFSWDRVLTLPSANPGVLQFSNLPILVLAYRTICYRDVYPAESHPNVPDGRRLSDEELEYLDTCVLRFRDFYWRNSSCRLHLDARLAVVEDTLWLSELGAEDPYWLSPSERVAADVERQAEERGWRPEELAGVIASYAWLNYKDEDAGVRVTQSVGGGSNVVPAPWKLGQTSGYSGNPFPPGSRQDWLMIHEFHHQLDALLALSGHPEYPHADTPWQFEGRFGEDYSFNAAIIRSLPPGDWLTVDWGSIKETPDGDKDGLPDSDPLLPRDEERLGSDPRAIDTDNDGLSDLAELMMGFFRGTDPLLPDSDQDGRPDLADPSPMWPIDNNCRRAAPTLDGVIEDGEWHELAELHSDELNGRVYTGWSDQELLLAASLSDSALITWKIDSAGDGWFHGDDNVWVRYDPWGGEEHALDVRVYDSSSWREPPRIRYDLSPGGQGRIATGSEDGRLTVEIAVPREAGGAFRPEVNLGFFLRMRFATPGPPDQWFDLFDETEMIPLWYAG
jgi:hypothetical protein